MIPQNKGHGAHLAAFVDTSIGIVAARLCIDAGIKEVVAQELARNIVHDICVEHGGTFMYVAKDFAFELTARDQKIYEMYTGRNMIEVTKLFGITHTRVLQICKRIRDKQIEDRQHRLCD